MCQQDICPTTTSTLTPLIAITSRGNCTFSVKAQNAHAKGYVTLIVFNTNTSMYTIGSPSATYTSPLPVYAVGGSCLAPLVPSHIPFDSWAASVKTALDTHGDVYFSVREPVDWSEKHERYAQQTEDVQVIMLILERLKYAIYFLVALCVLCVLPCMDAKALYGYGYGKHDGYGYGDGVHNDNGVDNGANQDNEHHDNIIITFLTYIQHTLPLLLPPLLHLLLPLLFLALRMATLRRLDMDVQDERFTRLMRDYNHKETDEVIYEV
ncbi:hypothetical protein EON63_17995 [archaeon]|nr:MAG: hypothetical protein EON63_17995 [archaeon]